MLIVEIKVAVGMRVDLLLTAAAGMEVHMQMATELLADRLAVFVEEVELSILIQQTRLPYHRLFRRTRQLCLQLQIHHFQLQNLPKHHLQLAFRLFHQLLLQLMENVVIKVIGKIAQEKPALGMDFLDV